jgi:hypothetical protein
MENNRHPSKPLPFWDTKPLSVAETNTLELVQETHGFKQPEIPEALEWDVFEPMKPENASKRAEFLEFLQQTYFSHTTPFQIVYTDAHIRYELHSPSRSWVVVLRRRLTGKLVACIAGDTRDYVFIGEDKTPNYEALKGVLVIEFLCILPSLRSLGLAPKLITEISRIAHDEHGIQKAYYNSISVLPGVFCKTTNYCYPLHLMRCIEREYVFPTKAELRNLVRRPSTKCLVRFEWIKSQSSRELKERCRGAILDEYRRSKRLYEEISAERFEEALAAECIWIFAAFSVSGVSGGGNGAPDEFLGCLWVVSHPYKVLNKSPPLNRMMVVLLYHYGFLAEIKTSYRRRILEGFIWHVRDHYDAFKWDSLVATQEEMYSIEGFQKGHSYYHYMYNIQMVPMTQNELMMIGV